MSDKVQFLVCNYREATSECSVGARAYVLVIPGSIESVHLLARSRSGRWIRKWENRKRLWNFRLQKRTPENPEHSMVDLAYADYFTDDDVQRLMTN